METFKAFVSGSGRFLQWLRLLRVQLLCAAFFAAILIYGTATHNGTLMGLSDGITIASLASVTFMLFLLWWTLYFSTRLVIIYGPARYGIVVPKWLQSIWPSLIAAAILLLPTLCVFWFNTGYIGALQKALAILLGFALAVAIIYASARLHDWAEGTGGTTAEQIYPSIFLSANPDRIAGGRLRILDFAVPFFATEDKGAGLLSNDQFRSGHRLAAVFLSFFLAIYFIFLALGILPATRFWMPAAMFFVFLLGIWTTWILSGLTFWLDRFHIPVMTTLLGVSLLFSSIWRTDHEFPLRCASDVKNMQQPLDPQKVIDAWERAHPNLPKTWPIVIVTAEGGGIEASAWANLVLNQLEPLTDHKLHDSIVLVSAVSGGSTAAYYYLDRFNQPGAFTADPAMQSAFKSSLSGAAWGLAYPDFARIIPVLGWFIPQTADRGYTMEQAWRHNSGSTASMREWMADTANGARPAVIFNATGVETGQPVLFGTTVLSASLPWFNTSNDKSLEQQFLKEFAATDMDVSTAARMSAAFPYVSPEARPEECAVNDCLHAGLPPGDPGKGAEKWWDAERLHVADGGLFDNSGVVSALHWIYDLEGIGTSPPGQRSTFSHPIILLMITSPYAQKDGQRWSWQHQIWGPIQTMLNVRTGSQHIRRNLEAQFLSDVPVRSDHPLPNITVVRFSNTTNQDLQTLSWHLTRQQSDGLWSTWTDQYQKMESVKCSPVYELHALLIGKQSTPEKECPKQ